MAKDSSSSLLRVFVVCAVSYVAGLMRYVVGWKKRERVVRTCAKSAASMNRHTQ